MKEKSMDRAGKAKAEVELKESFSKAKAVYAADFRGMTVAEITALRFELKKSQTDLKVIKNRVAVRATADRDVPEFKKHLDYMTALAFTYGDAAQSAKVLTKIEKDNQKFKLKGALLEGKVISLADVKALSKLPSRQELLAKLLGTFVAVPSAWVRVLNGVPAKWVYLLEAIRAKKEAEGGK